MVSCMAHEGWRVLCRPQPALLEQMPGVSWQPSVATCPAQRVQVAPRCAAASHVECIPQYILTPMIFSELEGDCAPICSCGLPSCISNDVKSCPATHTVAQKLVCIG